MIALKAADSRAAGGSERHRRDVQAILQTQGEDLNPEIVLKEVQRLHLETEWKTVTYRPQEDP